MSSDLSQWVRTRARELGFSKVGIARAEPLGIETERLEWWLHNRFHAYMKWMEEKKEARKNPQYLLPSVKSIVCVALNYYTEPQESAHINNRVKISRYAWGADYHGVVKKKLRTLLTEIQTRVPECQGRICVDSAPIMEKVWAQRSGIGWIGKNTLVLTREYGSWVFLGILLLSVELEYDVPMSNYCGTCRRCLEACPTQALVNEYVLDASRCIAYFTIEFQGEIPRELATQFTPWVYGCDICQEVCPWNKKFAKSTTEPSFLPNHTLINLSFCDIYSWTEEDYRKCCNKSPIKRIGYKQFIRNVTAIGQLKNKNT
ncbi:MAG: tRNA epoxyqueuosine(34) reductase QueG [Bacteroidetes bacterium]|nr:tRNA epoxyqueuosine(34) reductase QueG [Bacteroidota bacterium]